MASPILRKNVENLTTTDLTAIRDAHQKMMNIGDNRGYNYLAGLHGLPQFYCWHHKRTRRAQIAAELFLPWHRAYLLYFENALRDRNPNAFLSWWDWTSAASHAAGVPFAFSVQDVAGQANPLYDANIEILSPPMNERTSRDAGPPDFLPAQMQIAQLLGLTQYEDFSEQLEDIHDGVHGWVGGSMGVVPFAAFDPIFWSHHCMIDRIWYLWQLRNGANNIPAQYLPMVLEPFGLTVRDVLNINALGYEYANSSVVIV